MTEHEIQAPIASHKYDEAYFLSACEGYEEFLSSEGEHLSRRLSQAFELAEIGAGMRVGGAGY